MKMLTLCGLGALVALGGLGCRKDEPTAQAPAPLVMPPVEAYGHIRPVVLPKGTYFGRFHVVPATWNGAGMQPERYFFSTRPMPLPGSTYTAGIYTLFDSEGRPILVVKEQKP